MIIQIKGHDSKGNEVEFEAGFKFNNHAFEALQALKNINTLSAWTVAILYIGYKGWCFWAQKDERLTFADFSDYVDLAIDDENVRNNLAVISKEVTDSPQWKKGNEKSKETLKKNALPKKAA